MDIVKNIFCKTIIILGFILAIPMVSYASSESQNVKIDKSNGELTLKIEEPGDLYKIYKDEELVYEGANNTFNETMDYELQKYKIGVYEKNELKKVISLKVTNKKVITNLRSASTENKEDFVDQTIKNTRLETIIGDNSVTLQWPELPDEDKLYEIYKDDEKIAETTELNYIDTNVKPNTEYTYTIKVDNVLSETAKKEVAEKAKLSTKKLKKEDYTYSGTVSTLIMTPDNSEESLKKDEVMSPIVESMKVESTKKSGISTMAVPNSNEFSLDYRTFIPYKGVKNPNAASSYKYLKGDNRTSFAAYSNAYRTEASVYAMLSNPAALTLWPSVSGTYSCSTSACTDPKYVATASKSGIQLNKYTVATNNLRWSVNHSVPIPLPGVYPAIDYYYLAILSKSSFSVSGDHDKAPNHEFYMNYPAGSKKIHTYAVSSATDFWKLMGVKTTWSFDM